MRLSKSLQEMIDEHVAEARVREQFDEDRSSLVTLLNGYVGSQVSALILGNHCAQSTIELLSSKSAARNKGPFDYHGLAMFDVSTLRSILSS